MEDLRIDERIQWYIDNKNEVLAIHDSYLAEYDVSLLHRGTRATKREWIRHLDLAREAYVKERTQRASKQQVITRWLTPARSDVEDPAPQ